MKNVLKDKFNQMYFVLLYSAANPPLKKTRRIMGQVSFHKEFWDRYWGSAIELKGSLSRSQKKKKFGQSGQKIRGGGSPRPSPREHSSHL